VTNKAWFGVRLDFGVSLIKEPDRVPRVAEILMRPYFDGLKRLSARHIDRWSRHAKPSAELVASYLLDPTNEALSFDSGRGELVTTGQIDNGVSPPREPQHRAFTMYAAVPVVESVDGFVLSICDLANAIDANTGFVAVEQSHSRAQEVVLGHRLPRERAGLSDQRRRERRGRDWHSELTGSKLSGIEWGTLLGPGHLDGGRVTLEAIRESGAFARVIEIVPGRRVFLQLTADPLDDLADDIEAKLAAARAVLAPMLMNLSGVTLD
jgi:hypothetical protein